MSSKRMQTLNNLKNIHPHEGGSNLYINYQKVYKRVLREAKKLENDRYVIESTDRTRAMWRLINREIGKAPENEVKLGLRIGNK